LPGLDLNLADYGICDSLSTDIEIELETIAADKLGETVGTFFQHYVAAVIVRGVHPNFNSDI